MAQALEYAAFASRLDVDELEGILGEYHPDGQADLARPAPRVLRPGRSRRPAGDAGDPADGVVPELQWYPGHLRRVHLDGGRLLSQETRAFTDAEVDGAGDPGARAPIDQDSWGRCGGVPLPQHRPLPEVLLAPWQRPLR